MPNSNDLAGFSFAAEQRAVGGFVFADRAQAIPKIDGDAAVVGVAHHAGQLAVLDQATVFATKLEFVTVVINGP